MQEQSVLKRFATFLISNSPGMRVIKTFLAITLCLIIEHFSDAGMVVHSSIAAIVCMQPTMKSTFKAAADRTIGTFIAGLYAYLFIILFSQIIHLQLGSLWLVIIIGLMTLPLMMLMVRINKPGAVAITVIVFLTVVLGTGRVDPLRYTLERVLATLIGIGVALFINWLPFLNKIGERLGHVDLVHLDSVPNKFEVALPHPLDPEKDTEK